MKQIAILVLLTALLGSCITPKNASRKFAKLKAKCDSARSSDVKAIPANFCHLWYPVTESKAVDIRYLPGEPKIVPGETKYVSVDCDSALRAMDTGDGKTSTVIVKVPVYRQVDTQAIETTITKKDSAELSGLHFANDHLKEVILDKDTKITTLESKVESITKDRNKWCSLTVWPWVLIVLEVIVIILWLLSRIGLFKR